MKPDGSLSPGVTNFAITPAMNPMMIVQMMCMANFPRCSPTDLGGGDLHHSTLTSPARMTLSSRLGLPARLAVIATKVVHPGKSGQVVGWHAPSRDRRIARMNIHKNARLTPQGRCSLVRRVDELGWQMAEATKVAGISQRQGYR